MNIKVCNFIIKTEDIEKIKAQFDELQEEWVSVDLGVEGIVQFNASGIEIFLEDLESQGF